jgi:hypothetical protein
MTRLLLGVCILAFGLAGCTGGASGNPSDDIGDIIVLSHSPGNGDTLRNEDSDNGYNALDNPTLTNPGAVTLVFTNSLDLTSVINPDPADPQGTRNVRLFFFDTEQGPFDPAQNKVPGVNPPGANVLIPADTFPTTTNMANDTLIIRPKGFDEQNQMPEGQYSVVVEVGVRGADGDGMKGQEYFFYFRVGNDNLGPVVVSASPAPGERGVDPQTEIRITMSETILASSLNNNTLKVNFQPAGAALPTPIPGFWFTDGGNGPGNNFPALQLDQDGNPGFSGTSPRNGVDLVFRPDLTAFPVNMTAEDWLDPFCTLITDPPRKGNKGYPLGTAINVEFETIGQGVSDTAGNSVPAGSPNTKYTFETRPWPNSVYAPNTRGAVFYADTVGVGVIDVDPGRTPYLVGPNPARAPNSVVTAGTSQAQNVVRVPIQDISDITTDTRVYTAFHTFLCFPIPSPNFYMTTVYATSSSVGGGQVVVIDSFNMEPMGRFGTPSPGGVGITAITTTGRAAVSNFSANTITVFDIAQVAWYTSAGNPYTFQSGLVNGVSTGQDQLILSEKDFEEVFPRQKGGVSSPPGPPIIGTINVGISPTKCKITNLPVSLGSPGFPCFSPTGSSNTIVCSLNAGENTADFSELTALTQSVAIEPDLDGVNLAAQPTDIAWSPPIGPYYYWIASVQGSVELFVTGFQSNRPSVRPDSSQNFAPNKVINSITGLKQPSAVQWITSGNAVGSYTLAALVAETGENRLQQLSVTALSPSNLFETVNSNHASGSGPVDITGDPSRATVYIPCGPRFSIYYVANAGAGTVSTANYLGGTIGTTIPVPGIQLVASWWSR